MIYISASRERLQSFAKQILDACQEPHIDLHVIAKRNTLSLPECELIVTNDDMENRESDFAPETILVDVA